MAKLTDTQLIVLSSARGGIGASKVNSVYGARRLALRPVVQAKKDGSGIGHTRALSRSEAMLTNNI